MRSSSFCMKQIMLKKIRLFKSLTIIKFFLNFCFKSDFLEVIPVLRLGFYVHFELQLLIGSSTQSHKHITLLPKDERSFEGPRRIVRVS